MTLKVKNKSFHANYTNELSYGGRNYCLRDGEKSKVSHIHLYLALKVIWPLFPTPPICLNDVNRPKFSFYYSGKF
jgi:hypothetical protein